MACWSVPLSSCCTVLLLVVEGVAGAGSGRFLNGTLDGANSGCSGVADFWVIVFGASRSTSASASDRYGAATEENVGGVIVTSGGGGAVFATV